MPDTSSNPSLKDSSSFKTFEGNMNVVAETNPLWFSLENVDPGDCSDEESNGAVIARTLSEAGFETRTSS